VVHPDNHPEADTPEMARKEEPIAKYQEAWSDYRLLAPGDRGAVPDTARIAGFLEWAIQKSESGFEVGADVAVAAVSRALGVSRSTAGRAIERLVGRGLLAENPKAPYTIVSAIPTLPPADLLADDAISLTSAIASSVRDPFTQIGAAFASVITPLYELDGTPNGRALRDLEHSVLDGTSDPAIREHAAKYRTRADHHAFLRLRFVGTSDPPSPYLGEATFLSLPPDRNAALRDQIDRARALSVERVSFSEICKLAAIRVAANSRTRVTTGTPPPILAETMTTLSKSRTPRIAGFNWSQVLQRWDYGHFAIDPPGLFSVSVCFVCPEPVDVLMRGFDPVPSNKLRTWHLEREPQREG
jgi:hypothetical protein